MEKLLMTMWTMLTKRTMRGVLMVAVATIGAACRAEIKGPVDPRNHPFPAITGESLDGRKWTLPDDLRGRPALLLVAFEMEGQFDCDRWLLGIAQANTPAAVLEVPTIPGMVPGLFSGVIDAGMREGIPDEDWGAVVTVYGDDAKRLKAFTGDRSDRNARVFLLDRDGRILWYHERGYSARLMAEVDQLARAAAAAPP